MRKPDPDPKIEAMLEKAERFRAMADDLRAQAAKAIYFRDHPEIAKGQ